MHGVTTSSGGRCPCDELYAIAQRERIDWWANENVVVAPLNCSRVAYWTVLRPPVERILSRLFKPPSANSTAFRFMSVKQAETALTNSTRLPASGRLHELVGTSALNNWYVRSLCGPAVYALPLGAVNTSHLHRAARQLQQFRVVLPLSNLSDAAGLLSRLLGRCIREPRVQEATTGLHSGVSAWHAMQRNAALRDSPFMAALARHNELDAELYRVAVRLYEQRRRELWRRNRNPCVS